jgi:hypothetical protein
MIQLAMQLKQEKSTQKADILDWLLTHGSLTRMEAFTELGVVELSSRIGEIEKDGWIIPREQFHGQGRNGRKWVVTKYLKPSRRF